MGKIKDDPEMYILDHRNRVEKIETCLYYGTTKHFGNMYTDRITDKGYAVNYLSHFTVKEDTYSLDDLTFLVSVTKIVVKSDNFFKRLLGHTVDLFIYLDDRDVETFLYNVENFGKEDWIDYFIDNYVIKFEESQERSNKVFASKTIYKN
jgi:hypothetical protein